MSNVRRHKEALSGLPNSMKLSSTAIVLATMSLSLSAQASECYMQYDSSKCLSQQVTLQKRLDELYAQEEKELLRGLKDYDKEVQNEAVNSLRETASAYAKFKDLECYSNHLKEGMSLKDSAVLADSCRVQWRKERIKELTKRQRKNAE
jgi:predicted S18 family serine protease